MSAGDILSVIIVEPGAGPTAAIACNTGPQSDKAGEDRWQSTDCDSSAGAATLQSHLPSPVTACRPTVRGRPVTFTSRLQAPPAQKISSLLLFLVILWRCEPAAAPPALNIQFLVFDLINTAHLLQ